MTRQQYKTIALVILGIITVVMLFLAAFQYFKPDRAGTPEPAQEVKVVEDPLSTLYVSHNGGETWSGIAGARFDPFHLLFDTQQGLLLIGTQSNGLWQSATDSLSRTSPFLDIEGIIPENATIFDLAFSPRDPRTLYAAARYSDETGDAPREGFISGFTGAQANGRGYLVSLTGAKAEELFFAPLSDSPVRAAAADPFDATRIFIGAGTGLYESSDKGATWRSLHRFRRTIAHIVPHPHAPGRMFVSTMRGEVFRTSDYGETWQELTRGFSGQKGARDNQRLHIDAVTSIIYLTSDHGLLASWDDGVTWFDMPLIVPPDSLPAVGFAAHPREPAMLFVSASNQLYKSTNAGDTWKGMRFPGKSTITAIAINPADPDTIVIGFAE